MPAAASKSKATRGGGGGGDDTYEFEVRGSPAFSELEVTLGVNQAILADAGALAYMREGVERGTLQLGNIGSVIGRFLGGESLLLNKYVGKAEGSKASRRVTFACGLPGGLVRPRQNDQSVWSGVWHG